MFNKKLKNRIRDLEDRIEELEGQNDFECACVSERDKQLKDAQEIIIAQTELLDAFSEYIININKKTKKGA